MSPQLINEIRDLNLSYMVVAQDLIRTDKAAAMSRLGISEAVAEQIGQLSPEQLVRVASRNLVLCSLRFDDNIVMGLLGDSHISDGRMTAGRCATHPSRSARTAAADVE